MLVTCPQGSYLAYPPEITMNEAQRKNGYTSPLTSSHQQEQCSAAGVSTRAKSKANRLSRSFRQSQKPRNPTVDVDPPTSCQIDFKTPTRIPRPRYSSGFTEESPHTDSEFQQDIIWDATSPSPIRTGKRGKKHSANPGQVNISEIVKRIAPKHGRPEVPEPTLQEWIGDSAAIPCTPDVQQPRAKKKSPRPNGVDDLLKLAKQFDFNMFRQDEEDIEDVQQRSLELLSDDILDFESGNENELPPQLCEISQPAVNTIDVRGSPVQLAQDHNMDDDLDFLFDGPTQHISGNLSQMSLVHSLEVKPAPTVSFNRVSGPSRGPTSTIPSTFVKGTPANNDDFEDDWENDDILNGSLVFEVTQSAQRFASPKHSSTQRGSNDLPSQKMNLTNISIHGVVRRQLENRDEQSSVSKGEKENGKPRQTFKLETNPKFQVSRILTEVSTNQKSVLDGVTHAPDEDVQQILFPSGKALSADTGSQRNWQVPHSKGVESNPQVPLLNQKTPIVNSGTKYSKSTATGSNASTTNSNPSRPLHSEATSNHKPTEHKEAPGRPATLSNNEFLDEDLDSFFTSDSIWDDQDDDDLLCEMCEDLESKVQAAETSVHKQPPIVGHTQNHKLAPAPSNTPWNNRNTQVKQQASVPMYSKSGPGIQSLSKSIATSEVACGSSRPTRNVSPSNTVSLQSNAGKEPHRYVQVKSTSRPGSSACPPGSGTHSAAAAGLVNAAGGQRQFVFKRPSNPVTAASNKAAGKCSAAEIELKKRQAMERRRQRMQATQNLRALS